MKILFVKTEERVEKTQEEMEQEQREKGDSFFIDRHKSVPLKEPLYLVEMSAEELQLVSFYLELEKRKPIVNINLYDDKGKGRK